MAGRHRTENEPLDAWLLMQLSQLTLAEQPGQRSGDGAAQDEDQRQSCARVEQREVHFDSEP